MGEKYASIHIRCDNSEEVISALKKGFDRKLTWNKRDLANFELIGVPATQFGDIEPAVIVVRKHFVSVYWFNHIRPDNFTDEIKEYSSLCELPTLGLSVYDSTNFQLCAVSDPKDGCSKECMGDYWFDEGEISPVTAEEVCDLIDTPFLLAPLKKALSFQCGSSMINSFETDTGILIYMDDYMCSGRNFEVLYKWEGATVYHE